MMSKNLGNQVTKVLVKMNAYQTIANRVSVCMSPRRSYGRVLVCVTLREEYANVTDPAV